MRLLAETLADLQNTIAGQCGDVQDDTVQITLTSAEVALLSYALGGFTGLLLAGAAPPRKAKRAAKAEKEA